MNIKIPKKLIEVALPLDAINEACAREKCLLRWGELPRDWIPETDSRTPIWEALHRLIGALNQEGESAAGALLVRMPSRADPNLGLPALHTVRMQRLGRRSTRLQ